MCFSEALETDELINSLSEIIDEELDKTMAELHSTHR